MADEHDRHVDAIADEGPDERTHDNKGAPIKRYSRGWGPDRPRTGTWPEPLLRNQDRARTVSAPPHLVDPDEDTKVILPVDEYTLPLDDGPVGVRDSTITALDPGAPVSSTNVESQAGGLREWVNRTEADWREKWAADMKREFDQFWEDRIDQYRAVFGGSEPQQVAGKALLRTAFEHAFAKGRCYEREAQEGVEGDEERNPGDFVEEELT